MSLIDKIKLIQDWAGVKADGAFGNDTADAVLAKAGILSAIPSNPVPSQDAGAELTVRVGCELIAHEAIVLEAYKDSEDIWTWGVGVTSRSGHAVERYKDNPQSIERCLEIYVWLLRNNYIPGVLKAFQGWKLTEAQFAAALSFHYNTGAILKTSWVPLVRAGKEAEARKFLTTHYLNGGDLQERRNKEAALFFDGKWSNDGKTTVWPVKKPSYRPDWGHGKRVDIRGDMEKALAA